MAEEGIDAEDMSEEEQIGFHKGALSTLSKERAELSKMLNVVEQLMQMHIAELKELGVDLESQAEGVEEQDEDEPVRDTEDKPPIEDLLE